MHTYDAHGLPYFFSSSGVMQFREACYTEVSYAPYILLQIYTITILATFGVTIFEFFHPGPQPTCTYDFLNHGVGGITDEMTIYKHVLKTKTKTLFLRHFLYRR